MTSLVVDPGPCGFTSKIQVVRVSARRAQVTVESDCEQVNRMGSELADLDIRSVMRPPGESIVYQIAARHACHLTCPLPLAILKGIEAEFQLALPRPVTIRFELDDPG